MARVFHPVAQTAEAHLRWTIGTTPCETIFAYLWSSSVAPTAAELLNLATELFNVIQPKMSLMCATRVQIRSCYARNIHNEISAEATYSPAGPYLGQRGGNAAPGNVAIACTKRTGFTGRSRHGVHMWSGFSSSDITGDTAAALISNQLVSIGLSVVATRVGGRFIPCIASRKLGQSQPMTAYVLRNDTVDDMGRRLPNPH